jgi:hypothetical protein
MIAGKMIYADSIPARFAFVLLWFVLFNTFVWQKTLIQSVQTCLKLKMMLLTPLLTLKITPMLAAIYGTTQNTFIPRPKTLKQKKPPCCPVVWYNEISSKFFEIY